MKKNFYNIIIIFLLIIGGFALSSLITPSKNLYGLVTAICLLPTIIFLSKVNPVKKLNYKKGALFIIFIGTLLTAFRYFQFDQEYKIIGIIVSFCLCIKALENKEESTEPENEAN